MAKRKAKKKAERQVAALLPWQTGYWPPAESELWPEYCRGKRWRRELAMLYVGKCQMCEHACRPPEARRRMDAMAFLPEFLLCTEHPDSPGQLRQVTPTQICRNFRQRREQRTRVERKEHIDTKAVPWDQGAYQSYQGACRIELSGGYFAIVDAKDFAELSKYKWSASNKRGMVYAVRRKGGRTVYMHREIMKPRKGQVVDHINCRIWDNRRCNLRRCKPEQNQVNRGPRGGSSKYVGVVRLGDRWEARLVYRGKLLCLGRYDTEIEAAQARDRKAYELLGPYAYLNFPEDFQNGRAAPRRRGLRKGSRR